ncbi:uncharacterized protein LOC124925802 [Impatiens glandulifera]|uniref:uncharacterized protein LOC124925802 n=1 Tax=Impatiens glandulifera TaxID=253017 RepID=UPI001FB08E8A|nr:uncharacterized protein LOC124925802 [Impatiens glandulifera]XP_047321864.1 uncharacterized protein LOC124925802 [Impatiens glandulifera]
MMMDDEKSGLGSSVIAFEEKNDSLSAMLFGASCAFFALRIIMNPEIDDDKWSIVKDRLHQGCTYLLGLLVWRVQKERLNLEDAEIEIEELKRRRREDGKANEKVMGIISTREQRWLSEKKKFRRKIGDLLHELRVVHKKSGEAISELQLLKDEEQKRIELEAKLKAAEAMVEELREASNRKDQDHCTEIWKHKTAFFEVVSNQRQLEAEMGRALRQAKASKQELDSVSMQKEESILMVQKLSMELMKIRKDLEQKDNILSVMLRKSKLDTTEKQLLLNEVKLSKSKPKQAELETELFSPVCFPEGKEELFFAADIKQLEGWVCSQAKKYIDVVERQHQLEIDAFAEQMRLKDEKLEACRWRLMSMDLESKRLHAHIEGLDYDLSQLRQDNMKLEASLLDRESLLRSFKKQMGLGLCLEFPNTKEVAITTVQSPESFYPVHEVKPDNSNSNSSSSSSPSTYNAKGVTGSWKMDLHALGVSYKIKRLKHQMNMLEMLTRKQLECPGMLELHTLMSLLNKQVNRYESLQAKVDDLCKRMNEKNMCMMRKGEWNITKTKEETKSLEQLLEETFQLQRYIVSTGQRLIEIQSKIGSEFVVKNTWEVGASGFDAKRFAENLRSLFLEVQRGIEVRISQVIGDLEGTLARDGMMRLTLK